MKTLQTLLCFSLLLLALPALAQSKKDTELKKQIIGKWYLKDMAMEAKKGATLSPEEEEIITKQGEEMKREMDKVIDKAYFDFRKDGSIGIYNESGEEETGKWSIEGERLVIDKDMEGDGHFGVSIEKNVLYLRMGDEDLPNITMVMKLKKK